MYGKIHQSLFTGSMVGRPPLVFALWSYVIACTRPPGEVELNPRILATIFGVTKDEVQATIDFLCSPDPESRTKDHEGRRLLKIGEFLYDVPTHAKYRDSLMVDAKRRCSALRSRRYRARKRAKEDKAELALRDQNALAELVKPVPPF